jgi:hypothetical protein
MPHQLGAHLNFVVVIPGIPQHLPQLQTEGTAASYWRTLVNTVHTACAASLRHSFVQETPGKGPPVPQACALQNIFCIAMDEAMPHRVAV